MLPHHTSKNIVRDISWLAFNARVLQEAGSPSVPLYERIRFLGIFSNNLDEFFRVRVATLRRMLNWRKSAKIHLEDNPASILDEIQEIVIKQQHQFHETWISLLKELRKHHIHFRTESNLNREQKRFVEEFFTNQVQSHIIPLMLDHKKILPDLHDKSIYLAVVLSSSDRPKDRAYSLIEIPTSSLPRFVMLPSPKGQKYIILLEDLIRFCLPSIFSFFDYDQYDSCVIKLTRDAELDIDNDINKDVIEQIRQGIKERKKGKPVRLIFDREIDTKLLQFLVDRLSLTKRDNLMPGDRIHNFKDFMNFPRHILGPRLQSHRHKSFIHPILAAAGSIQEVVLKRDVLLSFPYHSFNSLIDLLREAAIDPEVQQIKITAYRLARHSQVINALISAAHNGKEVTVILELRARFDEEANLSWKTRLEDEGVRVHIGLVDQKVHAKIGLVTKKTNNQILRYGFISTGNLNEETAKSFSDECLLTSDKQIMSDLEHIFKWLEHLKTLKKVPPHSRNLVISPYGMREQFIQLINREIKNAQNKKSASILLKMNSLSDEVLIDKLYEAAKAGVEVKMIIRGICCVSKSSKKWKKDIFMISLVDEYLEHARIFVFHNHGKNETYLSSADWMVRNLDHRFETAVRIKDSAIKKELMDIMLCQLSDNVKARTLNDTQENAYHKQAGKKIRSQVAIYQMLKSKNYQP